MNNEAVPSWRKRVILATCCLSLFLVTMDVTIVNVALPSIRRDLQASVAGLQWSIDGYTVVVACFLLLSGSMADRFGRRRTFQIGLSVFSLGSLLCSLAPTTGALVAFRMLQAIGGSMMNPVAMSIIVNTFTDARERARAIGIWGGVFGVSMAAGPLLGGVLVETVGWRSIFWVNVPVGLAALALTARFVPESRAERPRRFDLVAQALVILALLSLTSAVIEGRREGWTSWHIAAGFALACWRAWWRSSCGRGGGASLPARPEVLPQPAVRGGHRHGDHRVRGVRGLPVPQLALPAGGAGPAGVAGRAHDAADRRRAHGLLRRSPGRLVGAGRARVALVTAGCAIATGGLMLTRIAGDTPMLYLGVAYGVFGVGLGSVNAPITNNAVSGDAARARRGSRRPSTSTSRQVGASLGVALAGSLAGSGIRSGPTRRLRGVDACRLLADRHLWRGERPRRACVDRGAGPRQRREGRLPARPARRRPGRTPAARHRGSGGGPVNRRARVAGEAGVVSPRRRTQATGDRAWQRLVAFVMDTRGDWRRKVMDATGLPFSRVRALRRLGSAPRTLRDLAESMGTDAPAATVIVNDLEARELVRRDAHPQDRRAKVVSLTDGGKRVLRLAHAVKERAPASFDGLDARDIADLSRIVGKLRVA